MFQNACRSIDEGHFAMRDQPAMPDRPIFLDQTGLRWRLLRVVMLGLATGFCLLPFVLALSILNVEVLPERSGELTQHITTAFPPGYRTQIRRHAATALTSSRRVQVWVTAAASSRGPIGLGR
jgi:hypothetical protein